MTDLHVIFGTGPLGLSVMRELRNRGKAVRMVNRSSHVRFEKDASTQVGGINAADPAQCREACEGASVVYHCIGLPYPRWTEFAAIASGVVEGAASAGAKLIYADNLYAYGAVEKPMTEELPLTATTKKGRIRAGIAQFLMSAHENGKVRVAIARGSDFFGPFATDAAIMGSRVFGHALAGKAAQFIGNPDRLHTYTFLDDFGRALVTLGEHEDALGKAWHVPSAPAITTRSFVKNVFAALGKPAKLIVAPKFVMTFLGMFNDELREMREMNYQFERDFVMDSTRYETRFGAKPTPIPEAIEATLRWYRRR
ncbi:MAG: NAD-dependent epimerase/dehydratase family protein [Burkholderiales bacterium]